MDLCAVVILGHLLSFSSHVSHCLSSCYPFQYQVIWSFGCFSHFWNQASCLWMLSATVLLFDFLNKFQSLLVYLSFSSSEIVNMADFDIHIDIANYYPSTFIDILEQFDRLMTFPIHNKVHTLDVLITHSDSQSLSLVTVVEFFWILLLSFKNLCFHLKCVQKHNCLISPLR